MDTSKPKIEGIRVKYAKGAGYGWISPADLLVLLKTGEVPSVPNLPPPVVVPPAKPVLPLFGEPRRQVGLADGSNPVFLTADGKRLLQQVNGQPDTFFDRGFNLEYISLPGVPRPDGPFTDWSGRTPPPGLVKPNGYRVRYVKGDPYYEQSDLPDEVPPRPQPQPDVPPQPDNNNRPPDVGGSHADDFSGEKDVQILNPLTT